jgi:aspartyl aminopeptidase
MIRLPATRNHSSIRVSSFEQLGLAVDCGCEFDDRIRTTFGQIKAKDYTAAATMTDLTSHAAFATKACEFLTNSPDPFHAVANCVEKLEAAGFVGLRKRDPFAGRLAPGGKYYYTINHSTLVAFTVGGKYLAGNGFVVLGGHTDSPNLKVKPRSQKVQHGCLQLGVECYGGGLWHTWFDRDLGISGRVLVRGDNGMVSQKLVKLNKPVARVSTLCIHLQSAEERASFQVNKENHMIPIIGTHTLLEQGSEEQLNEWQKGHEPLLLKAIAEKLGIQCSDIADFELNLFDVQPASLGGIQNEFLNSARLDNLATVFCGTEALVAHSADICNDEDICLLALFDHEEVGSQSAHGAGSPVMMEAVRRISDALSEAPGSLNPDLYSCCIRKSFVLSSDMSHAIHPNYPSKHELNHAPKLNGGVVIKTNSNQRYATNAVTSFFIRELARNAGLPIQEFVVRNDCPCGSTIGPIISAGTGIRTVDIGMPQLSMHSCREVMGVVDRKFGMTGAAMCAGASH